MKIHPKLHKASFYFRPWPNKVLRVYFTFFNISLKRRLYVGFKLWIQIEQADFTDSMSFLPPNFLAEISINPETLSTNT